MSKVMVSQEIATALDKLRKDEWTQNFELISHAKQFSGNGILMRNERSADTKLLNSLSPLVFAKCLINGYEVHGESE